MPFAFLFWGAPALRASACAGGYAAPRNAPGPFARVCCYRPRLKPGSTERGKPPAEASLRAASRRDVSAFLASEGAFQSAPTLVLREIARGLSSVPAFLRGFCFSPPA